MAELMVIQMDEEKRQRMSRAAAVIMRAICVECPDAAEAYTVLELCRDTLGELCGIRGTRLEYNPTTKRNTA